MPPEMLEATVPLAMSAAAIVVGGRLRDRRRAVALNRALHEVRRPLQTLILASSEPGGFDPVLDALADLDAEINGAAAPRALEPVELRHLAEAVVARWGRAARSATTAPALRWRAGGARVLGDRVQLTRALDNLVANAIEHGRGPIEVSAAIRRGRLRVLVRDGGRRTRWPGGPGGPPAWRRIGSRSSVDPRRGHGLAIVRQVARAHGGRFALRVAPGATLAVLELPLADAPLPAGASA